MSKNSTYHDIYGLNASVAMQTGDDRPTHEHVRLNSNASNAMAEGCNERMANR
jgi:hypothetical protein